MEQACRRPGLAAPSTASRSGAEGHADHPGRRAARHPDPAVLRPPAARPGRRLPAVPGRDRAGNGRGMPKPQASCTTTVTPGMVVQDPAHLPGRRQGPARRDGAPAHQPPAGLPGLRQGRRVPAAEPGDVQRPGRVALRWRRSGPSPSRSRCRSQVLLDRERCIPCARCTRFSDEIAGDPFIELFERGRQGAGRRRATDQPFQSYFSGNTVQICPVGALTGTAYRFRSRPFDLVSTPSVVRALRVGLRAAHRPPARQGHSPARRGRPAGQRGVELRQGPLGVHLRRAPDRLTHPLVRNEDGVLEPASWPEALERSRPRASPRARGARRRADRRPASPSRTPTPTRSSRGSRSAPTTSTSVPARTRAEEAAVPRPRRSRDARSTVDLRRPREGPVGRSWPASSRRRSRRSCSCGCARRTASTR